MTYKQLTYRILILLAIVIALDRSIGMYLDHLYEKNRCNYSNGKINGFLDQEPCDTLYMGSSRVLHTIKPELLGVKSKNLSMQKKNICYLVALVDILKDKNKLPKKVLMFNFELEDLYSKSDEQLLKKVYSLKYYYNKNDLVYDLINRLGSKERIKFLSSIYRHNGEGWKLLSYPMAGNCEITREDGYYPLYPGPNDSIRMEQSLIDDFKPMKFDKINPLTLEMLDKLKDICDEAGITLQLISVPYYKMHPDLKKASKTFQRICKDRNISFYEFNDDQIPGLDQKKYWFDNMHLNDDGATIYSKYLKAKYY